MGVFTFVKAGKQLFNTIKGVGPKVNKTKLDKAESKLNIAKHKTKMSKAKLKNTLSDIDQASKTRIERKFGGGADMGSKKLSAKQMKIASLAGNKKKIDGPDFKKLRAMKSPISKSVKKS